MPVSDPNPLYQQNRDKWKLVRDCVEGSASVKRARAYGSNTQGADPRNSLYNMEGSKYLPVPNQEDTSTENRNRYIAYRDRANFVNFTSNTKDGLIGMATRVEPQIELHQSIQHMEDNATGSGMGIVGLYNRTLSEVLEVGRYGLLVDYPQNEDENGKTIAQTQGLECYVKCYPAESIINWKTDNYNGQKRLTMVVLAEDVEKESEDGFKCDVETWHRVLYLNDGVYEQQMYDADDNIYGDPIIPRDYSGNVWREIPFCFVGTVDNDPVPDNAVLYDLAEVNIAHYRNSADFEESCFMVGQPTPVLTGLTKAWVEDVMDGEVHIGSRSAIMLPEGGNAVLMQAGSNQMPENGMKMKEEQMVKIGAKIISDRGGNETAEAARIRFAGQTSKLSTIVNNIEKAFEKIFEWSMMFMGGSGENTIELNRDFYDSSANPQMIMAQIQLLDRAVIAKADVRDNLKEMGVLNPDRTDEEIDVEMETSNPLI